MIHTNKELALLEKMETMYKQLVKWEVEGPQLPDYIKKEMQELQHSLNYKVTVAKEKYSHLKGETVVFSKIDEKTNELVKTAGVVTGVHLYADGVYVDVEGDDERLYLQPLSSLTSIQKAIENEMALSMSLMAKIEGKM